MDFASLCVKGQEEGDVTASPGVQGMRVVVASIVTHLVDQLQEIW